MAGYLADLMLGRLTTYLRMTGYDVEYAGDLNLDSDDDVLDYLDETGRTLLTRDRELSRRADDAVLLESLDVEAQLCELADSGFDLRLTTPDRCSRCNGRLEKDADAGPPDVGRAWR
ncbi:MAG: Mut7-C RNAse domain-containing protein, partial [Halobacteriota archaeon]